MEGGYSIHGDPRHAVDTGLFGASYCSARTAAYSRPRSGLVESPNVADVTPSGSGRPVLIALSQMTRGSSISVLLRINVIRQTLCRPRSRLQRRVADLAGGSYRV